MSTNDDQRRTKSYHVAVDDDEIVVVNQAAEEPDLKADLKSAEAAAAPADNGTDGTKGADDATAGTAPPQMPVMEKPKFRFWALASRVHRNITSLPGYGLFLAKIIAMQIVRISAALSFVVAAYIIADDFDVENIGRTEYIVFGVLGALYVLGSMVPFLGLLVIDRLKESLQASQATAVVSKIFDFQYDAMVTTPTGEFVQLITKVFQNLDTLLPAMYGAIFPMILEVFVAVIVIGVLYGPICLIQLGLFLSYSIVAFVSAGRKAKRNQQLMTIMFSEWGSIIDTATAYERAHFFGNVDHEVSKTRGSFDRIGSKFTSIKASIHKEGMALNLMSLGLTVVFILILPVLDISGIELAALALYFLIFISSMTTYATGVSDLRAGVQEYEVFDGYVNRKSEIEDIEGAIDLHMTKNPSIEFENVSFTYGGKQILDNISFTVKGGETVGLVGPSGCGKSTIMRLLLRFYRPTSGIIRINGTDIAHVKGSSLRRLFSVMPQNAELFNAPIRENIAYGKMGCGDDEILKAAELAELPLGEAGSDLTLAKECGEKGAKLSGGQQQRVALARAMLKNGTIYLLDEPTTALDAIVAEQLQKTLDVLCTHATTLYITHHLNDLKNASHIMYLEEGKIVERGTYDDLEAAGGRFSAQVIARSRSET